MPATALTITLRRLLQAPKYTASVIATLAICLGANLTIFAVVDAILVRSLPFPHSERLVLVYNSYPGTGVDRSSASVANYFDRRHAIKALSSISLHHDGSAIVGGNGSASRMAMAWVTPEFFETLGVALAKGRTFTDDNLAHGADRVAVITDGFWKSYFGADPNVIGRTFEHDRLTETVVGVLPLGFRYLKSAAQYYLPDSHEPGERQPQFRHSNGADMIARLAPGATVGDAQSQINAFNAEQTKTDPSAAFLKGTRFHTVVASLHGDYVRETSTMLILVQAGALFLLFLGCVNIANLLLVRASARTKEYAIRRALGASRADLIWEILTETLILTLTGGLCGMLLARAGIDLQRILGTDQLPLGATIELNGGVALAGLAAVLLVGVALCVPIAWFHLHGDPTRGLQADARGGSGGRAAQRLRHSLVVVQIALAFTLLSGAGLLGMSLKRVLDVTSGFRSKNVLTGRIDLPWNDYKDGPPRQAFISNFLNSVRLLPGVDRAAVATALPFAGNIEDSTVAVEGNAEVLAKPIRAHYIYGVTPDYWRVMEIPLLRGRFLADSDLEPEAAKCCIIDEAFAERYWPGVDPIGKRLTYGGWSTPKGARTARAITAENAFTVVGVVRNVKQNNLTGPNDHGTIYSPMQYLTWNTLRFFFVIRTDVSPAMMAPMIRKTVLHVDPGLPVDDLRLMADRVDDSLVIRRSPAILTTAFGAVALLLAAIGTYGVLSYAVAQRRPEIGLRMALGAQAEQIRNQFVSMGARLFAFGAALGIFGAWAAGLSLRALLFGIPTVHAPIIIVDILVMGATTLFACLLPARRAMKVNPMEALRAE